MVMIKHLPCVYELTEVSHGYTTHYGVFLLKDNAKVRFREVSANYYSAEYYWSTVHGEDEDILIGNHTVFHIRRRKVLDADCVANLDGNIVAFAMALLLGDPAAIDAVKDVLQA